MSQLLNDIGSHPGFPGIFKDLLREFDTRIGALEAEVEKLKQELSSKGK